MYYNFVGQQFFIFSFSTSGHFRYRSQKQKKRKAPLAAHAGLQVEEADFAVAAVPARHVAEAVAVSCLRVALARQAGGAGRVARARWRKQTIIKRWQKQRSGVRYRPNNWN